MQEQKNKDNNISGVVIEALPNTLFKIKRDDNGQELICYLAGKMRINLIRIMVGDKVIFVDDPYGGKGRIIRRI